MSTLLFELWLKNSDTTKNISLSVSDLTIDSDPILLKNNLFMFGVYVISDYNLLSDETYISMRINQTNTYKQVSSSKIMQLVNWTYDNFPNI